MVKWLPRQAQEEGKEEVEEEGKEEEEGWEEDEEEEGAAPVGQGTHDSVRGE